MYYNVFGEKVSRRRFKEMCNAAKNRRELIAAGLTSRRDLFKMGLLTSGGMLIAKSGLSARAYGQVATDQPPSSGTNTSPGTNQNCVPGNQTQSPQTRPFLDPLVVMPLAQKVSALSPTPTLNPNTAAGEVRAAAFQAPVINSTRFPVVPGTLYQFNQRQFTGRQTADTTLPVQTLWGFDDGTGARSPGPTYQAFYGKPQLTRNINSLPLVTQVNNSGFGMPSVTTHLHNAHNPSESDGNPCDFYSGGPLLRPVLSERAGGIQLRLCAQRRHQRVPGHLVVSRPPGGLHLAEHLQGTDGVLLPLQPVRHRRQQHRFPPARLPGSSISRCRLPTGSTTRLPASWCSTCSTWTASSATSSWSTARFSRSSTCSRAVTASDCWIRVRRASTSSSSPTSTTWAATNPY